MTLTRKRTHQRGQVLVIFAAGMIGLLAMAALAIDLSSVYSSKQTYKAAADAAALAGGQDLQKTGTRSVGPSEQATARQHALEDLAGRFGVLVPTGSGCDPSGPIVDCQLTPDLLTSISSPSRTTNNPRSIQVSVHNPNFQLSFSRLWGQNGWDVGEASVAVIGYTSKYAVITLEPPRPKPNGTDANLCKDLEVNGTGTLLNVLSGDIGTNTSATTTNSGEIRLADGYTIDHIDDIAVGGCSYLTPNATWSTDVSGLPAGKHIGPAPLIQDPSYPLAKFSGAPTFASQNASGAVAGNSLASCGLLPGFPSDPATVAFLTPPAGGTLTCYNPGIYSAKFSLTSNKEIAYLMPGVYRFDGGMKLGGKLAGGMTTGKGVVLTFPQSTTLDPNNSVALYLNSGSATCTSDACRAAPATDFSGAEVKTPDGLTITIEVPIEGSCFSGTNPVEGPGCNVPPNATITLGGGGLLTVGGVIYAPSDNVSVAGNASTTGYVGQIVAWTVKYSGKGTLEQSYPGGAGNAVLHLDTACSGGNTPCIHW